MCGGRGVRVRVRVRVIEPLVPELVRVRAMASCNPSRLGLGWGLYLWRRVAAWPCGKGHSRGRMRVVEG